MDREREREDGASNESRQIEWKSTSDSCLFKNCFETRVES